MPNPDLPLENLYVQIKAHLQRAPDFDGDSVDIEAKRWAAKSLALIKASNDVSMIAKATVSFQSLDSYVLGASALNDIYMALLVVVESLELRLPASVSGTFIPAGAAFDAHAAFSKVVSRAQTDVLLVDPYLDEKALTEFGESIPLGVLYRLLADQAGVKASLGPAARKWADQYGATRPLEVRLTKPKTLHDRLIVVDHKDPWTVTQSLNQLATRSHAEFVLARETADLKIPTYEEIWTNAEAVKL